MADMSDMFKNFASMMDGKEIPDNIKEMLSSFAKENNNSNDKKQSEANDSPSPNIDINTLMKMQKIMSSFNNSQNNSSANLLKALKPYLKPSRQAKVDEYIQLLSLEKVIELMNNSGGDDAK